MLLSDNINLGSFNDCLIIETSGIMQFSVFGNSIYHYLSYSLLFILFIFLLVRYQTKSLRKTRRLLSEKEAAYEKITTQREQLEIKNKNITDSITYASYIQQALLPSDDFFRSIVPDSFIFFKPKDIVSGDFYWIRKNADKIFIVAADCTGHGVPGAFMSMIGVELLNNIIIDQDYQQPSKILGVLSEGIERTFHIDDIRPTTLKDGMDIGLCVIDTKKEKLEFAGAYFPLYIIRENNLIEIKGDKLNVGITGETAFNNNVMDLYPDDTIYMFSDGYADQFGGPDNKKFMYRRFRHLLLTIHNFPIEEQKTILRDSIEVWAKDWEQVDDIMVIGVKPF